ncbi:NAD(P)H-dependent oxidoreductase [Novosphingobium sp. PASSN1]|uniref:NAD(P)H-dependent oxidoreductase n=1 Tax=Novosphingobium sp. PASSN1 TaxID=2015561 RepID=UPI0025FE3AA8|nr:NAD(P)H-dependent oxidoreductase [Novosphingobium sp. PASSN1]
MNALALFPAITTDKVWIHDQLAGLLERVADHVPAMEIAYRDLSGLLPAAADRQDAHSAAGGDASSPCATRARSDQLVGEIEAAELVVIGAPIGHHPVSPALAEWSRRAATSKGYGAPLYAMGLHPQLQAWFSHVIRADRTFRYTAQGPRGLLGGKKALVLAAHTGPWHSEAMTAHQVHCIHTQLQFMGINEIATIVSDRDANPARRPRLWQPQIEPSGGPQLEPRIAA